MTMTTHFGSSFTGNHLLSRLFIYSSILVTSVLLGKLVSSTQPPFMLVVASGCGILLLPLVMVKLDAALLFILFFLIIPFTLGVHRLGQVLQISNFLIIFTFICWLIRRSIYRDPLVRSPLEIPVFGFLGLVLLSYFRNPRPLTDSTNIHYVWAVLSVMIYLLLSNIIKQKEQIYRIRHGLFVFYNVGFLICLYIAFKGGTLPMTIGVLFSDRRGGIPLVSGGGVHGVGQYGIICLYFLLCQPSYIPSKWIRGSLMAIYFAALSLSGSRSILVMLLGTLVLTFLIQKKLRHLAVIMVAIVVLFIYVPRYFDRLPVVVQRMFTFSQQQSSIHDRLSMWKASWELIQNRPIVGIGFGSIDPSQLSFIPYHSMDTFSRGAHNGYVFIIRTLGLVGIGIFGWMIFMFFKYSLTLREEVEELHIKEFVFFLIVTKISSLIGMVAGGGGVRPGMYMAFGLIGAIYVMYPCQCSVEQKEQGKALSS